MKTRTMTAAALAMGLLSSIDVTGMAAAPTTPVFALPKTPATLPVPNIVRTPVSKIKNAAPASFLSPPELNRIAAAAAAEKKRSVKTSSSTTTPTINVSFTQQPEGVTLDLFSPWWVHFANNQAPTEISFHANTVPSFDPNKGHAGVELHATAGNLYVIECPLSGGPTPMYRQTTHSTNGAPPVIEMKGAGPVAYLATANVVLDVDVQGHLLDGEDYSWGFKGCRITTFAYQ